MMPLGCLTVKEYRKDNALHRFPISVQKFRIDIIIRARPFVNVSVTTYTYCTEPAWLTYIGVRLYRMTRINPKFLKHSSTTH